MESFWKEYTIFLPAKKEFVYDIQNQNANCVIIRNYNLANVKAGLKPHTYELFINPNRIGILNRPFPLNYVYLITDRKTPINIIETITQNPINNFIQQKISKNIIAQNAPQVCEELAYKQLSVMRELRAPPSRAPGRRHLRFSVTLDCGIYGRPLVNIVIASNGLPTFFSIGFSNDNINYFFPYRSLQISGAPYREGPFLPCRYYPCGFERNHINLLNAFRYVRVTSTLYRPHPRGHRIFIQISGIRCHTKNRRQLVTQQDGF